MVNVESEHRPAAPRLSIGVVVRSRGWREDVPSVTSHARAFARRSIAAALSLRPCAVEATIVLADDEFVRNLNRDYRAKDLPTNVLSFPDHMFDAPETVAEAVGGSDNPFYLGDVILARETVLREAQERGIPTADHLAHLVIHGILHLLGYDHVEDADAERMEALETSILAAAGIADPYVATTDTPS